MHLQITSASGNILTAEKFSRITLMTEAGEITVLPGHEPILSAIRPWVMFVEYFVGNKLHSGEYATGGGVLNISPESCMIVADMVEHSDGLTDLEYIEVQKQEAAQLVKDYHEENGATIDPHRLIELEYELLKYTAMHQLGHKHHSSYSGRR